jgi:hypothetical protein
VSSRRILRVVGASALAGVAFVAPLHSAYPGHANNPDVNAVLAAYPALKGTPADSCAICHRGGDVKDAAARRRVKSENHCDYCHAVFVREKRDVKETLNGYGRQYLGAGRGTNAVRTVASRDADGDGATNEAELRAGTNPGDASSSPSMPLAPSRSFGLDRLRAAVPVLDTTVLLNTTKSRSGDSYSDYRGYALWDLLLATQVSSSATHVDVLSADGYEHTFTIDELQASWPQGSPVMGLGKPELGACGWVTYSSRRLEPGTPLPSTRVLLAFEENGQALEPARVDAVSGRLSGKGPLRVIVPQFTISPPDLPETADPSCAAKVAPEYRFHDEYEHNGGAAASAVVAVRVRPLPAGTRDIDWQSSAAAALARQEIVVFGAVKGDGSKTGAAK